jgi:hypothetical protein
MSVRLPPAIRFGNSSLWLSNGCRHCHNTLTGFILAHIRYTVNRSILFLWHLALLLADLAAVFLIMLPTHRRRPDGPLSGSPVHTVKLCFSKSLYRWVLCLAFASSLWFLGPYLLCLDASPRQHPHDHIPDFPTVDEHSRHPPRPASTPRPRPQRPMPASAGPSTIWSTRAAQVREAYLHAWNGYQKLAAPYDELLPVSDGKVNK